MNCKNLTLVLWTIGLIVIINTAFSQIPNDGIFADGIVYTASPQAGLRDVFIHDLDNDGDADVVAAVSALYGSSDNLLVFMNNGDGTLAPKVEYDAGESLSCGNNVIGVCIADINNDSYGDILFGNTACSSGSVLGILKNNGNGTFGAPSIYSINGKPDRIRVFDLDGDGDKDAVVSGGGVAGNGSSNFSVLMNNGNGTFGTPAEYFSGPRNFGVYTYDLDNDGDADIVSSNSSGASFTVSFNNGSGIFGTSATYSAGGVPREIFVTDFDADGDGDVVVANQKYEGSAPDFLGSITIYKNNGNGTFSQRADYITNGLPVGIFASDLDGDGDADIVAANHTSTVVSVFINNGTASFSERRDFNTTGGSPMVVSTADMDNDGDMDIVSGNWVSGSSISILLNSKPGIRGTVFLDSDENCAKNLPDEIGIGGKMIRLESNTGHSYYVFSNTDGKYAAVVPAGTYTISLIHNNITEETCNGGDGITYNRTITAGGESQGNDFFVRVSCGGDMTISNNGFHTNAGGCQCQPGYIACKDRPAGSDEPCCGSCTPCPCDPIQFTVTVTPNTTINSTGTITVDLGPLFENLSGISSPCITSGNLSITSSTSNSFVLDVKNALNDPCVIIFSANTLCDPAIIGSIAYPKVELTFSGSGCEVSEDEDFIPINCSWDPNDKKVSPTGTPPCGNVPLDQTLTYNVRFQNLGTAPAYNVIIRDELDDALDKETFEPIGSSHPYTSLEIQDNTLVWTFKGINLPDAYSTNDNSSIGYIKYRIKPRTGIDNGAIVTNKAAIYFDNNPAVITNTTMNILGDNLELLASFNYNTDICNPFSYNFFYHGEIPEQNLTFSWNFGEGASPAISDQPGAHVTYSSAGTKTVTLTVAYGECTATSTQEINVSDEFYICHLAPPYRKGGVLITPQPVSLKVPYSAAQVHFEHGDYCGSCLQTQNRRVGAGDDNQQPEESHRQFEDIELKVFPNPNQGTFTLNYQVPETTLPIEVTIINMIGEETRKIKVNGDSQYMQIHLADHEGNVPSGLYLIRLTNGERVVIKKVNVTR